jgi:2'-5' RNA ligase
VALAVCLLFDPDTDRAVRRLWSALEEAGLGTLLSHTHRRHVPHLSYAVLRTYDVDAVAAAVRALPPGSPLELHFDAVGLFPRGRAALLAPASEELLSRQRSLVEAVAATGADLHWHYRPGRWLPHCSLTTGTSQELLATAAVRAFDVLPLRARADRAALIDSGSGQHWPLATLP